MEPATNAEPQLIMPDELAAMDVDKLRRRLFLQQVNEVVLKARADDTNCVSIPLAELPLYADAEFIARHIGTAYKWNGVFQYPAKNSSALAGGLYIYVPRTSTNPN